MPEVEHRRSKYLNNRCENSTPTDPATRTSHETVHLSQARAAVPVRLQRDITALPASPPPAHRRGLPARDGQRLTTWNRGAPHGSRSPVFAGPALPTAVQELDLDRSRRGSGQRIRGIFTPDSGPFFGSIVPGILSAAGKSSRVPKEGGSSSVRSISPATQGPSSLCVSIGV